MHQKDGNPLYPQFKPDVAAQILAMKCVSEEEEEVAAGKGDGRGWCKGEAPGWQVREGPTGEKKKKVHAVPDEPIGAPGS